MKKILPLLVAVLFYSCHNESNTDYEGEPITQNFEISDDIAFEQEITESKRKLIKTGEVIFKTKSISETRKNMYSIIKKYKGYISSDESVNDSYRKINSISIRIPADKFDDLLYEATKDVLNFDKKNIEVKDITEHFLDIQTRVKTKKELEKRYLELLQKANNVNEMLEVEKQIGLLRSEIESMEGKLKYYSNQVSFSTLNLSFYETMDIKEDGFTDKFKYNFKNGWSNIVTFLLFLVNLWPFIILCILIIILIKHYFKRKRAEK